MSGKQLFRLEGLEPDNLLAFLALLGVLRAVNSADRTLCPRVSWTLASPPLRPVIHLSRPVTADELTDAIVQGLESLAGHHVFDGRKGLNHTEEECRDLLNRVAASSSWESRERADLLAALMTDAAIKDGKGKTQVINPTPMCLLFGQGHQHFLQRLADVPGMAAPPRRRGGQQPVKVIAHNCIKEALFQAWEREDDTPSFRWDPLEDIRYATMAGDPTDPAYKARTQHGANRLAAVGIAVLTLAPESRAGCVRPGIVGGMHDVRGRFSFAWPIWRDPATLSAILALLSHPGLREVGALSALGIDHVMVARRISVGKFMNFTRARAIPEVSALSTA